MRGSPQRGAGPNCCASGLSFLSLPLSLRPPPPPLPADPPGEPSERRVDLAVPCRDTSERAPGDPGLPTPRGPPRVALPSKFTPTFINTTRVLSFSCISTCPTPRRSRAFSPRSRLSTSASATNEGLR